MSEKRQYRRKGGKEAANGRGDEEIGSSSDTRTVSPKQAAIGGK